MALVPLEGRTKALFMFDTVKYTISDMFRQMGAKGGTFGKQMVNMGKVKEILSRVVPLWLWYNDAMRKGLDKHPWVENQSRFFVRKKLSELKKNSIDPGRLKLGQSLVELIIGVINEIAQDVYLLEVDPRTDLNARYYIDTDLFSSLQGLSDSPNGIVIGNTDGHQPELRRLLYYCSRGELTI